MIASMKLACASLARVCSDFYMCACVLAIDLGFASLARVCSDFYMCACVLAIDLGFVTTLFSPSIMQHSSLERQDDTLLIDTPQSCKGFYEQLRGLKGIKL